MHRITSEHLHLDSIVNNIIVLAAQMWIVCEEPKPGDELKTADRLKVGLKPTLSLPAA